MVHKKNWEQLVTPKHHLEQIQELIKLLQNLEASNANESSMSCQSVVRHSIDICQNYLVNMLRQEKQRFLLSETKERNKQLLSQLNRGLDLLAATNLKFHSDTEQQLADYLYRDDLDESEPEPQQSSSSCEDVSEAFTADINIPLTGESEDWSKDLEGFNENNVLSNTMDSTMNSSVESIVSNTELEQVETSVADVDVSPDQDSTRENTILGEQEISLNVYTFKQFSVFINSSPILNWPNGKGMQLFKYLIIKRANPVPKEVLMDVFWHDYDADSARNNLNVAIYSLRQNLKVIIPDASCILFKQGCYQINPEFNIWVDSEAFDQHYKKARILESQDNPEQAIGEYQKIEKLYRGDFMAEDSYEEWTLMLRESYKDTYIEVLNRLDQYFYDNNDHQACVQVNKKIVEADPCNEIAHQRLMENYNKTGQRHLALRQYHTCVNALEEKFDLQPSEDMLNLFRKVKRISAA